MNFGNVIRSKKKILKQNKYLFKWKRKLRFWSKIWILSLLEIGMFWNLISFELEALQDNHIIRKKLCAIFHIKLFLYHTKCSKKSYDLQRPKRLSTCQKYTNVFFFKYSKNYINVQKQYQKNCHIFQTKKDLKTQLFINQIQNLMYLLYLILLVDKWKMGLWIQTK